MSGSGMMGGSGSTTPPPRVASKGMTLKRIALTAGGQPIGSAVILQPKAVALPLNSAFRNDVVLYIALAAAVAALLAVAVGIFATRRITAPLEELTSAAAAMGRGGAPSRAASMYAERTDEVGELASTFNEMAAAIERQEDWRRSMSADLAHELRTPLATIQARVEALQDGVLPASAENLAVIGDEVQRCSAELTQPGRHGRSQLQPGAATSAPRRARGRGRRCRARALCPKGCATRPGDGAGGSPR